MIQLTRRNLMAGAAATAALGSAPQLAHGAAPMIGKQGPSFYRYKVGDFEVTALSEGIARNPNVQNMALNQSVPDIQKALTAAFLPTDHVVNQFTVLVVNTGKNLVLIDSGFGDNGSPTVGGVAANMAAAGIDPKTVDTILVSHFHGDHVSGIRAKGGAANFPNAEIMVPSGEWKYWTDEGEASRPPQVWKSSFPCFTSLAIGSNTRFTFAPGSGD
jgi:glyoxylase-like metal-dependent hydrolase (beta-lactamase superfamily II)